MGHLPKIWYCSKQMSHWVAVELFRTFNVGSDQLESPLLSFYMQRFIIIFLLLSRVQSLSQLSTLFITKGTIGVYQLEYVLMLDCTFQSHLIICQAIVWLDEFIILDKYCMKGKVQRKFKRYLTEPQQFSTENKTKYNNLTLKQLKLQVGGMDNLNDIYVPSIPNKTNQERSINDITLLQAKIQNKRTTLKRLPQISNTPHFSNGKEDQRPLQNPPLFKTNNPLFVVNTLFQILKEDTNNNPAKDHSKKKIQLTIPEKRRMDNNEFQQTIAKSVKVYRPPRVLGHQLTRLTQQSTFARKIYSEEKSRPKMAEKQVQLLTFYKPKQKKANEQINQFL